MEGKGIYIGGKRYLYWREKVSIYPLKALYKKGFSPPKNIKNKNIKNKKGCC